MPLFQDFVRTKKETPLTQNQRQTRRDARNILRDAVMLIPNLLKLLYRLFKDNRVPLAEKAFLTGAIVYVISPLDLLPDVVPFIGQVDDLYLVALTMLRLLGRAPIEAIDEHWDGPGDLAGVVQPILRAAQYVLPKRIQHILLGRVELAPKMVKGGLAVSPGEPIEVQAEKAK
jgi:uncharacterized membrane protein YkvA (DUF1232 family)